MTHKLATWIDQFGTSGCVGCGRCITWCPVAIDITEEAAAIRATDRTRRGEVTMQPIDALLARRAGRSTGLPPEHRELIAGCAHERASSSRRATCCARVSRRTRFFVIRRGDVALEMLRPAARRADDRDDGRGDVLGWSWLFPPYRACSTRARRRPSRDRASTAPACAASARRTTRSATS